MSWRVVVSPEAAADLDRLEQWLLDKHPLAAERVGPLLRSALASLAELPHRGHGRGVLRELVVRFGQNGYIVRYRVFEDVVLITRVFHAREDR